MLDYSNEIWIFVSPDLPGERSQLEGVALALEMPYRYVRPERAFVKNALQGPRLVFLKGDGKSKESALQFKAKGSLVVRFARSRFDPGPFDLVFTAAKGAVQAPNVLHLVSLPSKVNERTLQPHRASWRERLSHLPRPWLVVLLGGHVDRKGSFTPGHVQELKKSLRAIQEKQGGSLLLVGSRRMWELPSLIEQGLDPDITWSVPWKSWDAGENPYLGLLANADAIVATADSLSMISEAAEVGKKTYFFGLDLGFPYHRALAEQIMSAGFASELPLDGKVVFGDAPSAKSTETAASRIRDILKMNEFTFPLKILEIINSPICRTTGS